MAQPQKVAVSEQYRPVSPKAARRAFWQTVGGTVVIAVFVYLTVNGI